MAPHSKFERERLEKDVGFSSWFGAKLLSCQPRPGPQEKSVLNSG